MGKNVDALAEAEKEPDEASKFIILACVYWDMGRHSESDSALGAVEKKFQFGNLYGIASAHAYRGDVDAAFAWLDRTYQRERASLEPVKFDPLFRKLHGDPRFDELLRKVKLVD